MTGGFVMAPLAIDGEGDVVEDADVDVVAGGIVIDCGLGGGQSRLEKRLESKHIPQWIEMFYSSRTQ